MKNDKFYEDIARVQNLWHFKRFDVVENLDNLFQRAIYMQFLDLYLQDAKEPYVPNCSG